MSFAVTVASTTVQVIVVIAIVLAAGALLIAPVAVLFLAELTNPQSIAVLVLFAVAFTVTISLNGVKADNIFLGLSAYLAVLVSCLANLQGGCQCS